MMRSLYAGVTGLKSHQTKMDVIGNNIANVNTVGFKSSSMTFNDLMYQTVQRASGPNALTGTAGINARQIGLGVKTGAINTNIATPGATQTTGNPFDIKITGDAFFIINNGSENFFSRDGSFGVDAAGNLATTGNGYNVMGWQPSTSDPTSISKDTVSALKIMNTANMTYPPEATSKAEVSGIIDMNDKNVNSESGRMTSLQFYDALGYSYNAKISYHATADPGKYYMQLDDITNAAGVSLKTVYNVTDISQIADLGINNVPVNVNENLPISTYEHPTTKNKFTTTYSLNAAGTEGTYTITETKPDGSVVTPTADHTVKVTVDPATGKALFSEFSKFSANQFMQVFGKEKTDITDGTIDGATGNVNVLKKNIDGGLITFDTGKLGTLQNVNNSGKTIKLDFKTATGTTTLERFADIDMDMSKVTYFDNGGTSTIGADPGIDGVGEGRPLGAMSSISIQTDGKIYASYDNNMVRLLGQIAVAEFANPSGLEKMGDNLYKSSQNSGRFDGVGEDITSNGGYMQTGVLEMSNVDLSTEFTELITTQRGFQANSRIITNSDTMLEELVNLKR